MQWRGSVVLGSMVVLLATAAAVSAAPYRVSTKGHDANSRDAERAVACADHLAVRGAMCMVRPGVYRETAAPYPAAWSAARSSALSGCR